MHNKWLGIPLKKQGYNIGSNCVHRLAMANAHCALCILGQLRQKQALNVTMQDIYIEFNR